MTLMEGRSVEEAVQEVKDKFPKSFQVCTYILTHTYIALYNIITCFFVPYRLASASGQLFRQLISQWYPSNIV